MTKSNEPIILHVRRVDGKIKTFEQKPAYRQQSKSIIFIRRFENEVRHYVRKPICVRQENGQWITIDNVTDLLIHLLIHRGASEDELVGIMLALQETQAQIEMVKWLAANREASMQDALRKHGIS